MFLLDQSRSMSLETPISRSQAVDQFISRADGLLSSDRRPAIQKYGFGRELSAIAETAKSIPAIADETRLLHALEQLPPRLGETFPLACLSSPMVARPSPICSTRSPRRTGRWACRSTSCRWVTSDISGDVAVQDIDAPRDARPGTRVPVRVTLRSPRLRGQAHRGFHPCGRRPQGRCACHHAHHAR